MAATAAGSAKKLEFQPRIVPSSVANMNTAGAEVVPFETTKLEPVFETAPVGALGTCTGARNVVPFGL